MKLKNKLINWMKNGYNFLRKPYPYLRSFYSDTSLGQGIVCIMCGYNEFENVELALSSVVNVADKVIFVDKNGDMEQLVMPFSEKVLLDYYVKPELNLLESRMFAVERLPPFMWILVVDADEVLKVDRQYLMGLMNKRVCYRTRMIITHESFSGIYSYNDPHPFFMPNDNLVFFRPPRDVPRYKGRCVTLSRIAKENRAWCKDKRHRYYRTKYWKNWQFSDYKDKPIEDYIIHVEGKLPSDSEIEEWYDWIINRGYQT